MAVPITPFAARRSTFIAAEPARVWEEFESLERMRAWFGVGHQLKAYEPGLGGLVEVDAGNEKSQDGFVFGGRIIAWEPGREVTWENDWYGHGWHQPSLMTIRLSAFGTGTIVELFHHRLESIGPDAGEMLNGFEGGWDTRHLEALRAIVEA